MLSVCQSFEQIKERTIVITIHNTMSVEYIFNLLVDSQAVVLLWFLLQTMHSLLLYKETTLDSMSYVISGSMQKVKNIPSCLRFAFVAFGVRMQAFISDSCFIFTDGTVSVRTYFL